MISVVIPLYNKEKQVAATLRSVLQQTYRDFEIVIVDDGSTDGSAAVVQSIRDPRIRLVRQENAGVSAARNRGIAEARCGLIAFLDADDRWKPDYLQTQHDLAKKYPQCSVFACNYEFVQADGTAKPAVIRKLPFEGVDGVLDNYFEVASCSHPPLWTSAVVIKKEAIESIGGFPAGIRSGEDLLTWARLACKYRIAYMRIIAAEFRVMGYSMNEQPKRPPDEKDRVGKELRRLLAVEPTRQLRLYISHWHKMRSSIYLRQGARRKCIKEACAALSFNFANMKVCAYMFLAILPSSLRKKILSGL